MTDAERSELPTGWAISRFEDLVSNGGVFSDGDWVESKDQDPNGDVRLVQLADIGEMRFLNKSRRYMTDEKAHELNCTRLRKGDLLISRLGDPLGKTCVYPANEAKAVTAVDVCILRPSSEGIVPKLFGFFLNGGILRQSINAQASGTTRKRITGKKLKALPVPVPPANEQERIVEKIETLFARLDKGEEAVREVQKLLKRYRQSILKSAVIGELTADWRAEREGELESGADLLTRILKTREENWQGRGKYKAPVEPIVDEIPEIPKGWSWCSLDALVYDGPTNGVSPKASTDGEGVPSFKLTATTSGEFLINDDTVKSVGIKLEEDSKFWLKTGDVLVQRGNTIEYVGTTAIFPGPDNRYIYPDLMMRLRFCSPLLARWATLWMNFEYARKHFRRYATGTAGNMPKINSTTLKSLAVPVPSEAELKHCIELVEDLVRRISPTQAVCKTELKRSAALRQSILKDAFSGRLVPQDPKDEPASVLLERIQKSKKKE